MSETEIYMKSKVVLTQEKDKCFNWFQKIYRQIYFYNETKRTETKRNQMNLTGKNNGGGGRYYSVIFGA